MYPELIKYAKPFSRNQLSTLATCLIRLPDDSKDVHAWADGVTSARDGRHVCPSKFFPCKDAWEEGHKAWLYAMGKSDVELLEEEIG